MASQEERQDLVASVDTGGRAPDSKGVAVFRAAVAFVWSCFQLWYASPIGYDLGFGVFNSTEARSIHLSFALFLGFLMYPALRRSPRRHIPLQDWVLAVVAASCSFYLYFFYQTLSQRPNNLKHQAITDSCVDQRGRASCRDRGCPSL